jgi:hypothetical protein
MKNHSPSLELIKGSRTLSNKNYPSFRFQPSFNSDVVSRIEFFYQSKLVTAVNHWLKFAENSRTLQENSVRRQNERKYHENCETQISFSSFQNKISPKIARRFQDMDFKEASI